MSLLAKVKLSMVKLNLTIQISGECLNRRIVVIRLVYSKNKTILNIRNSSA